ncbi:unnamed protein product [Heterobilharzia americana]|nr:unnamed protein product [Heterobilharzia americana]
MVWIIAVIGCNILLSLLWICFIFVTQRKRIKIKDPVLVVTAHPDDESMFFAPTILNLLYAGYDVDLLCLTTGDYNGLGQDRKLELSCATKKLGVRHLAIIDSDKFKDGPNASWSKEELVNFVCRTCQDFCSQSVISFDDYGVSGHKNHCTLGKVLKEARRDKLIPHLYCLRSVSTIRKYCFFIDLFLSILFAEKFICSPFKFIHLPYVSMYSHKSQLVWFRWLYMYFSVYMYKNSVIRYEV